MILIDTSVWIDHLRVSERHLVELLEQNQVCIHPYIIGELACGNLKNREEILSLLYAMPKAKEADHEETMFAIRQHQLMGKGVGYIDASLLASTLLTQHSRLWTRDTRLHKLALSLGVAYQTATIK